MANDGDVGEFDSPLSSSDEDECVRMCLPSRMIGGLQDEGKGTRQDLAFSELARLEGRCVTGDTPVDEDSQDDIDCGRSSVELEVDEDALSDCS